MTWGGVTVAEAHKHTVPHEKTRNAGKILKQFSKSTSG